jgi:hypothetical protein
MVYFVGSLGQWRFQVNTSALEQISFPVEMQWCIEKLINCAGQRNIISKILATNFPLI